MEKGKDYIYSEIETFAAEKELEIKEYGKEIIGANFLSLESDSHDNVAGFVLGEVIPYYYHAIPPSSAYFCHDDNMPNLKKHRLTCDKNRKKRKSKRK